MKYFEKYWIVFFVIAIILMYVDVSLCVLSVSSFIFYLAVRGIFFLKKLNRSGIKCLGRILSFEVDADGLRVPTIEFKPYEGELVAEKPYTYSSTYLSRVLYNAQVGDEVSLLYDRDDPKKYVLSGKENLHYSTYVVMALICFLCIVLAICMFLGYVKFGKIQAS